MVLLVTALSVIAFILAFEALGIVPKARDAIATSRQAAAVMGDKGLDDDAKEAAMQKAAGSLMKGFVGLLARIVGILLAAYAPIFLADLAGLADEAAVLAFMLDPLVIVATTVIVIAVIWVAVKVRGK